MDCKFFYLYLAAGTVALVLLFCEVYMPHARAINGYGLSGYVFAVIALYYLAFKTYHEKKDKELM